MAKEKNLVEDALIQMKNLEEAVAENAKGILASTMKQEIKDLVKESIVSEQGDDETEKDDEMDMDSDMSDIDMSGDDEVIDLSGTDISDEDLLKVFLAMDENDGVIVKKDNKMVNLKDENTDKEYMIQMESEEEEMDESYEEMDESEEEMDESYDEMDESMEEEMDESYEEMDEEDDMSIDAIVDSVFGRGSEEMEESEEENEEVVYEIEMDEEEDDEENEGVQMESMKPKVGKGAKIGKPKFTYKKSSGGFKETMKKGTKGVGMGKPKFEFKEGKKDISDVVKKEMKPFKKKEETKEAARTYGMGSKSGRGLRKGITPNRNLTFENEKRNEEQIKVLREKNEEYRKALNLFRDKLNEVAIFNSNLAYATRLFTEHSTSKQEKINILRRFDDVETIKESKNLYRTIKNELSPSNTKGSITESIEGKIEKSPSSGSAVNLIESKTYENPQFLRMKDIMSKITK